MKILVLVAALLAGTVTAQNLGATLAGVFGSALGMSTTFVLPGYGTHAALMGVFDQMEPEAARDQLLDVFTALSARYEGTVSMSIELQYPDWGDMYTLVMQSVDGVVTTYVNGELFAP
jgi:hypothetical protein